MLVLLVDRGGTLSSRGCDCNEMREVHDDVMVCLKALWFIQPHFVRRLQGWEMSETTNIYVCLSIGTDFEMKD